MADLIVCALLVWLLLRVISEGDSIEVEDLLHPPSLLALAAFAGIAVLIALRSHAYGVAGAQHFPALGMLGLGACGLLLVLFPTRMPDVARGGTLMTGFWIMFGWLLMLIATAVVLWISQA